MFISFRSAWHPAMIVTVLAASAASATSAAVTRWNCNLSIPNTTSGLFIDLDTRTSSASSFTGWDMQLYSSDTVAGALTAFGATGTGFMRAPGPGGLYFGSLPAGTSIGSGASFTPGGSWDALFAGSGTAAPGVWSLNSENCFGFRYNGVDGLVHYGFGSMRVGASSAIRTLSYLEWESTPGATVICPAPGALSVVALAGLRGRRRRR